jgi:formylglycine-generating enzyme required for sulfatase activity
MKYVEGGCFMMGAPDDDVEALDNEKPSHKVSLDSYYIAETLVTQELWEVVMGTNVQEKSENGTYGHYLKGIGPNHPMYYITWDDCQEFIHKLNGLNLIRQKFSLPSEAQWEFAARGGIKSKGYKYSGSNELDSVAYCRTNSKQTHSVAEKKANELGLYDMTGNVWEWCQDSYDENYYTKSPIQNPLCSVNSDIRVSRGGAFKSNLEWYRLSYRNLEKSNVSYYGIGMRLVINIK